VIELNRENLRVDGPDLWPRYYFDLERARLEIADWLAARKQEVVKDWCDEIIERDWRHELLDRMSGNSAEI